MGFWSGNTKMVYFGVERNGCRRGECGGGNDNLSTALVSHNVTYRN